MKKPPLFFAKPLCPKAVKSAARHPQHRRQRGASAIEYAVIIALIATALVAAFGLSGVSDALTAFVGNIASAINPE
ncbi:Flp family type IVb pilin [Halomonas denitrificans]|uniref:Flp family type IVb pilin n=1 Tax=Halomonas denitrificans TaxID=370769 RepID=UPI001CD6686B|nr:Flp family type IVb pilin [Halomonas denitrificans]